MKLAIAPVLGAALAVGALALCAQPEARATPVTLVPGESAIWNFGFPASPVPPLQSVNLHSNGAGVWVGRYELFAGLNGTGSQLFSITGNLSPDFVFGSIDASVLDGEFSLRLTLNSPTARSFDPFASIRTVQNPGTPVVVFGTPLSAALPEPATALLASLALGGMTVARRRRLQATTPR